MSRLSGRQALTEIDAALGRARSSLADVEQQYAHARESLARLRHEEVGVYTRLAKLRLLAIEGGNLLDALDNADHTVAKILEERSAAAARLDATIEAANARLGEDETRRAEQQDVVAAASEALDAAEGSAQAQLLADPQYQAQLKKTEQADFVADQAEDKAESARRDRLEKGKPYEDDPLFAYLWARGYGTSSYSAWPLTRWLDAGVARLCGYEAARRDYALLIEIPERLAEHAAAMRAGFDSEVESLRALEAAAAAAADVPGLAQKLNGEQERIAVIDAAIAAQEDELRKLVRDRVQFANGNDPFYARCIEVLAKAMRREGFGLLRERAARTREPEDDRLVERLVEIDSESDRLGPNLHDFRRVYERDSRRLEDLEDVRRRFKSERFDDSRSEFLDAALFTLVLERFLNGAVNAKDVWKVIRRQQRMRVIHADPRFGTGRFPRAPRRGPWSRPPGGGFGGGGFGSGGGFGGGGFRSGGGF